MISLKEFYDEGRLGIGREEERGRERTKIFLLWKICFLFSAWSRYVYVVEFCSFQIRPHSQKKGGFFGGGMFFWIFFRIFWDEIIKFYLTIFEDWADLPAEFWPAECHFWPLISFWISFFCGNFCNFWHY